MLKIHESMKRAAGEQRESMVAEISHRLHLKPSTVYKWAQPNEDPTDSGSRGPGEVLLQFIESCLILGRPRKDALAPLDFLEHRFNRIAIDIPEKCKDLSPSELSAALIRAMKECGDVVAAHEKAVANKRISKNEMREIERESWEAVKELIAYLHCAREAANSGR